MTTMASRTPTSPDASSEATTTGTTATSPSPSQAAPLGAAAILTVPSPGNNRKRSLLWRYFTKLNEREARCDNCSMKIATAGNTTNMMKVNSHTTCIACIIIISTF